MIIAVNKEARSVQYRYNGRRAGAEVLAEKY